MSTDHRLVVNGLGKKYAPGIRRALWYGVRDVADELFCRRAGDRSLRKGEFWALNDVSFSLGTGEALAILGHNGAGKSTLLKLLFGLLKPDRGEIRATGRTEGIIELGAGINPLLSGRENVKLWASLHGFSAARARALIDVVLDFSELGAFFDAPVQSYSSGMAARLAFGLAANLDPQILLVDEVLAVGDVAFQRKCVAHMLAYLREGGSLVFVSHNTFQVQAVCGRGLLLEKGAVQVDGTATEALAAMLQKREDLRADVTEQSGAPIAITAVHAGGSAGADPAMGRPMTIEVDYRSDRDVAAGWGFSIWTGYQWVCVAGESLFSGVHLARGGGSLSCVLPTLPLLPGRYLLKIVLIDPETMHPLAMWGWEDVGTFFDVRAEDDLLTNAQLQLNQLVRVDVNWR